MADEMAENPARNMTEREIHLNEADFTPAPSSGDEVAAGEVAEIGRSEVGTDGQLVSYELVRPGRDLGETGNSARGKAFAELKDSDGNEVSGSAEIRLIGRVLNQDSRDEIVGWMKHRDLNVQDPDKRLEVPPATETNSDGNEVPEYVRHGRILGIEVRHPSADVEVDIHQSDISIPASAFY